MDLELRGRTALVTGGSQGIGLAIARTLVAEGVNVAIGARDRERLDSAAAELRGDNDLPVLPVVMDTGDDDSVREGVAAIAAQFGGVDILVNCAARPNSAGPQSRLDTVTEADFHADLNIKVLGYLRCSREVAPHMIAQGWGRIVNISGLGARQTGSIVGTIRNVAVVALTKNLADELGSKGINVNAVHPGVTRTEKSPQAFANFARKRDIPPDRIEAELASENAIGRLVDASEVADVVAFLASPRSVAINGDTIAVAGGRKGPIHY